MERPAFIAELLEAAGKATPGKWKLRIPSRGYCTNYVVHESYNIELSHADRLKLLVAEFDDCENGEANAAYVACANPANIIELARYIEELEAAREAARNEALEEAARLIEENTCATSSETGQYLTPRMHGDNHVIGYATAIRAMKFKGNEHE